MNIGIDGYEANVDARVGIGRYAYEILTHIYSITKNDNVIVFLPSAPRPDMPAQRTSWKYMIGRPARLWTLIGLPLAMKKEHLDVMFSPTHYAPRFINVSKVISIMDLSYLAYPTMFRAKDLHQLINWTRRSVHVANKILTISEFSRNAIIKEYKVEPSRVVVTYPGLSMQKITHETKSAYKNYILSVGTLQPRKNYERLIEAFSKLHPRYNDVILVIVGKKGWLYEDILQAPKKYGVDSRVKFLDFVPDRDLPGLYKNALCFVLTSLYEGFGLPVAEAMANSVPVVVSNTSSLPEIAGKAGIYVDPENVTSIAQGLSQALEERGSDSWEKRIALGLKQVKKFTWEEAAKKTLAVLIEVARGNV